MAVDSGHGVTATTPQVIDDAFSSQLRLSRSAFVDLTADETIAQTGAVSLGSIDPIPEPPASLNNISEARIETFVVDLGANCTPTGTDLDLITHVREPAAILAERTIAAMTEAGVQLEQTGYLTASVTPSDQVATNPHFDDDQYLVDSGVSIVAIAADLGGTRVARQPIAHHPLRPNLPVEVPDQVFEDFEDGMLALNLAEADNIILFPQFGQLHAGPKLSADSPDLRPVRTLLVLRFGTVPTSES